MSAQRIEADLRACTDSFVNLVRAARIGDESAASRKRKAPGELVEVLAENMLLAAQDLLQTTAELKRRAFLANTGWHLAKTERTQALDHLHQRISALEEELAEAEEELGARGRLRARPEKAILESTDFQQLCALVQEVHGHW